MYFMICIDYGVYRLFLNFSYVLVFIKWNLFRLRELGILLFCFLIIGGLGDFLFLSGRILKRYFLFRFYVDFNNCFIRGILEEMLKLIELG